MDVLFSKADVTASCFSILSKTLELLTGFAGDVVFVVSPAL